ncbi:hypothetical protein LUR56_17625 [Streptomyces sp. MT29]|nr:hypothetical protein [Streptomyces sp. MT29]
MRQRTAGQYPNIQYPTPRPAAAGQSSAAVTEPQPKKVTQGAYIKHLRAEKTLAAFRRLDGKRKYESLRRLQNRGAYLALKGAGEGSALKSSSRNVTKKANRVVTVRTRRSGPSAPARPGRVGQLVDLVDPFRAEASGRPPGASLLSGPARGCHALHLPKTHRQMAYLRRRVVGRPPQRQRLVARLMSMRSVTRAAAR